MIDFDDLDGAEEEREEELAPVLAAEEAGAFDAEVAEWFAARIVSGAQNASAPASGSVLLRSAPNEAASPVGERQDGEIVCLARKVGTWALLHPLELDHVKSDYQDYWQAVLKSEVPRQGREAWIAMDALSPLPLGDLRKSGPEDTREAVVSAVEQQWLERPSHAPIDAEVLRLVQQSLTVVVSTSAAEHHCDPDLLLRILRGFQANEALRRCRKLVVFDALPSEAELQQAAEEEAVAESGRRWVHQESSQLVLQYERYKQRIAAAVEESRGAGLEGVELSFLTRWGHLVGTVRHALELVSTPFVLLHQHDLLLSLNFTASHVVGILRMLAERTANYVLLNRDVNCVGRSTQYFQAAPHRPDLWRVFMRRHTQQLASEDRAALTPFIGFSDQTHLARADWVRESVLPAVGARKCCMEFVLHEAMILSWLHNMGRWEKTFMLGTMLDGPFIFDLPKNGYCWAREEDAYSPEKEEDCYLPSEDRLFHPERPGYCLALYMDNRGTVSHYPDPDPSRNRRSRELFDLRGRQRSRGPSGPLFVHRWASRA